LKMKVTFSLLWSLALICRVNAAEPVLTIVANGQPNAVIIVPVKASRAATEGARILCQHLFEISGAHLKIIKENDLEQVQVTGGQIKSTSGRTYILVGESKLANKLGQSSEGLGPGGILIHTVSNTLVLFGPDNRTPSDPWGSRYAVTTFLEDALGCRYLWPGQSGKVIPRRKTISVGAINVRFTPLLKQRKIRWSGYSSRIQEGLVRLRYS
jgi:hypothetical protein